MLLSYVPYFLNDSLPRVAEAELGDADKAPGSRQYVTRSRVLRELAKMNDMDVRHVGSTAAVASPAVGASKHEQDGGAANGGGDGSGGGSGSVRFGAALERCREWGALEALLPKLQQVGTAYCVGFPHHSRGGAISPRGRLSGLV